MRSHTERRPACSAVANSVLQRAVSEALVQRADRIRIDLPREVWSRGKRPGRGVLFRFSLGLTFVLVGLAIPGLPATAAGTALGIAAFALFSSFIDTRLEKISHELDRVDRAQAQRSLTMLEQRRLVALFAPFAWVNLQKGRLHLMLGDGRAAARAFAEAARQVGDTEQPALVGAQAHGLTLSGDRRDARALLLQLDKKNALTPRDRVNLGIALVEDGRAKQAVEHLREAVEVLDDDARAWAALALALGKAGQDDEGVEALERADEIEDAEDDALAPELLKRARKALRPALEADKKGERKTTQRADDEAAEGRQRKGKKGKRARKKDKRKQRREKRKAAREEAPPSAEEADSDGTPTEEPAAKPSEAAKRPEPAAEAAKRPEPVAEAAVAPEPTATEPEKPKPPPVVFDGDKPIFRPPPAVLPPPAIGGAGKGVRAPSVAPPKIGGAPKVSAPKPTPPPAADDWGGVFGADDVAPVKPVKPAKPGEPD
jgi:tetratricopeptide (TPR) repeat protein